jgi:chromosome segregation ATPase
VGAVTLAAIAGVIVTAILGWLTIRATRRSTVDAKAANELAARDRLLEARDRDIEARDRLYEQIRVDRDHISEERDKTVLQLHEALERIDLLTGQVRTLEEQIATLRRDP